MKLYVANTSKQNHEFCVRLANMQNVYRQLIPAGQQLVIGDGIFEEDEIRQVVKIYERFGMRQAHEAPKAKGFTGLIYSIDKPVTMDRILERFEQNDSALNKDAQERREVQSRAIGESIAELTGQQARRVETEVQETGTVQKPDAGGDGVNEAIEVPLRPGVEARHEQTRPSVHAERRQAGRTAA